MIIPAKQFLTEVQALGFNCWGPRDREVFCPSESWLADFGLYLNDTRLAPQLDSWDCDDYALQAVAEASVACREASLSVGHSFVYCTVRLWGPLNGIDLDPQNITGHATNLVRLNTGQYVFFEPQNGSFFDAKDALAGPAVAVNALL